MQNKRQAMRQAVSGNKQTQTTKLCGNDLGTPKNGMFLETIKK